MPCRSLLLKSLAPLYSILTPPPFLLSFLNQLPFPLRPPPATAAAMQPQPQLSLTRMACLSIFIMDTLRQRGTLGARTTDGAEEEEKGRGRDGRCDPALIEFQKL